MTNPSLLNSNPQTEAARETIDRFRQQYGEIYYQFACYAAFPLALTPDFLYRLRDKFYSKLPVPWLAVAHLLLSDLCQNIGAELYEMDRTVRGLLLHQLTPGELSHLSQFSLHYIEHHFQTDIQGLEKAQHWTALAYVNPEPAAQEIARELRKLLQKPISRDWLRISSLVETLAEPLQQANFQPLLTLAEAMGKAARGNYTEAEQQFAKLRQNNSVNIAGVSVPLPPPPIPAKTFGFETVTVNKKGKIIKRETKQARYFTEDLGDGVTLEMVYIPGGTFLMGSPKGEGHKRERPQHQVTVPPFFMAKYPITQAQWQAVANWPKIQRDLDPDCSHFKGDPPQPPLERGASGVSPQTPLTSEASENSSSPPYQGGARGGSNRPVEKVKWYDAVEFCARMFQRTGRPYHLPSEAQWEYACRAGTQTPFYFGETLTSDLANYRGTETYANEPEGIYREETTPVGQFPPNAFGLYDLYGNVWEWCADPWHENYEDAPTQGEVWDEQNKNDNRYKIYSIENLVNLLSSNENRVMRGGSWLYYPRYCRGAYRNWDVPGSRVRGCGFRVASSPPAWTL
ncbi:conserved hypothetical protein [Planktothrix serta PCC 8927]|uniref:Sulfatase-modifying factor enzyme-like domain-containing protein n=1 Tax=Planktothrix serta PCC 8927 TaxID=671068 RepID=A0A7Z9BHE9_9CYAN|nr:formylglycine-generating enzyme family protein [Planktothrix serta]VXD11283.1 conserved hypothetical protein [Planktothrix serta PCC 8927]